MFLLLYFGVIFAAFKSIEILKREDFTGNFVIFVQKIYEFLGIMNPGTRNSGDPLY